MKDSTRPTATPLAGNPTDQVQPGAARLGFTLSSEEFRAPALLEHAAAAEAAEFDFLMISDHFHPWTRTQGNSPFVWGTLGALAGATEAIPIGTGVTCPTGRIHPAILAQAAATAGDLLPGRFIFGVGSGERLNEHVVVDDWPDNATRVERLEEAIALIRELWSGDLVNFAGDHFRVDRAQLFSLPDELPPIFVASGGEQSARLAANAGDGLVGVAPDESIVSAYIDAAAAPGPRIGQIQFCYDSSHDEALATALKHWPNAAFGGNISQEIALPSDFEAIAELVTAESLDENLTAGNDPEEFVQALNVYADAGYDHIYIHQIGPDQLGAIEFFSKEVLPAFRDQS